MFTRKDLARLIIPLIVEQFLMITIGMADTIMVASVGEAAVSGVSLVDSINILLINIFSALATGGAVISAQFLGRNDFKNATVAAKQLLLVTTFLSFVIMIVCVFGRTAILNLLFGNVETAVMNNSLTYFYISALSYPFIALYNAGAALFRSMGNTKVSMMTSLFMNVVNISVNGVLIFIFHMGVAGAAMGSLVSRFLSAVIIIALLKNNTSKIKIQSLFKLDFNFSMIKNILSIGVPNGIENGMFQIGKILVQGLIASFGTIAIAANAVAGSIANFAIIPGMAMGLAMLTVVGNCIGAGDYDQAHKYIIKLTGLSYAILGSLNFIILFIAPYLVGVFQLLPETAKIAEELIIYHSICCILIWSAAFTTPNGLRAANDVKFTMLTSTFSMWVFRIGLSYFLGRTLDLGVLGVWIAMTIDWLFRVIAFMIRFFSGKWKNHQLI